MAQMNRGGAAAATRNWVPCAIGAALLIAATIVAYLPAFDAGWFIMDDGIFVKDNPLIHAADGLRRFWFTREATDYWPVTSTTLWLEWRIWGLDAAGYHVTNIGLHLTNTLLLWGLLRRLQIPGAYLGALLFALHPLNVESVAWITERKNLVAMLFFLFTIGGYLQAEAAAETKRAGRWSAFSRISFALAMLSKGSVVFLPLVLVGIVAWQRRPTRQDLRRLAPYFLIAAGLALVESRFSTIMRTPEAKSLDLVERVLRAAAIVWFYALKAIWPANLNFDYGRWTVRAADPRWWLPLIAAVTLTAVLWRFRRTWSRPALFAWGYFCAALLPVMGFVEIGFMQYSPVSDHFAHLATIGVTVFAGACWAGAWARAARWGRGLLGAVAAAVVLAFGALAWNQNYILGDNYVLYQDILQRNPRSWLAHINYGLMLSDAGQYAQAIAQQREALRLKPDSPEAHNDLAIALFRSGELPEAMREYRAAVQYDPKLYMAHNNLGVALTEVGRIPEAIEQFEDALKIQPTCEEARLNLRHAQESGPGAGPK